MPTPNASSHFRPLADSVRVRLPFLKFSMASLLAFVVDAVLLVLCFRLTGSLLVAVVTSRIASTSANLAINGRFVFDRNPDAPPGAGRRYAALAVALVGASYNVQRHYVFDEADGVTEIPVVAQPQVEPERELSHR